MGSQKLEMGNEKLEERSGKSEEGNEMWEFTTIWIFQSEKWDPEKWEMGLKREFSYLKYPPLVSLDGSVATKWNFQPSAEAEPSVYKFT